MDPDEEYLGRKLADEFDELVDLYEENLDELVKQYPGLAEVQLDLQSVTAEERDQWYNFALSYAEKKGRRIQAVVLAMESFAIETLKRISIVPKKQ